MYVADMTATQSRQWADSLQSQLHFSKLTSSQREPAEHDLEDVYTHWASL
jgi:hypothetical protein